MFVYFLYNLYSLFHLKVSKISFSNLWLFPYIDDPLFQETPFEFMECRSGAGVGGYVELHPLVRGAVIVVYHLAKVFVDAKGLGHVLRCWLNVVVGCSGVCRRVLIPLRLLMRHQYILLFGSTLIISFLFAFIFFHPHNFNFFIQIQILKIKEFQLKYLKFLEF